MYKSCLSIRISEKIYQRLQKSNKAGRKNIGRILKRIVVMGKTINAKELIAERYGKEVTKEREKFREDAFSYYFGEIIKNRRKELQMTQESLARKIGKKRPYISRIEKGEDIRLSNFALVANALGLSIELNTI